MDTDPDPNRQALRWNSWTAFLLAVSSHKLESSQARVFVWFSTLVRMLFTNRLDFSSFPVFLYVFLKPEESLVSRKTVNCKIDVQEFHLGMPILIRQHDADPTGSGSSTELYYSILFLGESKENCVGRGGGELPTPSSTPTSVRKNRQVQASVTCVKIYCLSKLKLIAEIDGGGKLSVSRKYRRIWRKC